ncbi:MAG TPA: glycosyl hydrolase 53 family protein [Opitutaceae bacterium]
MSGAAKAARWLLPLAVAGCASFTPRNPFAGTRSPFFIGADISTLADVEAPGGVYLEEGQVVDPLKLFMRHGWTCFRLRIWVDPKNGVNGLERTTALARRIKEAGGTLMIDFHYSDWWADPQRQNKPAAWEKLDFDALVRQTQAYTAQVISTLKAAGATPDFVQVGNEITGGTLWPDGQVQVPLSTVKVFEADVKVIAPSQPYDDAVQWAHLIRIIKAGVAGVRSATTPEDHVRIVIHIDCGGDWPVTRWYVDHLEAAGVDFDIIGQSYYPNWHGTLENVRGNLKETIARYHKDVMVVETGYPARDVQPSPNAAKNMVWPMTPAGQEQFLVDLIGVVKEAPEGHGIGVLYWHPEATFVPGATGRWSGPDPRSFFDAKGNVLPAIDAPTP